MSSSMLPSSQMPFAILLPELISVAVDRRPNALAVTMDGESLRSLACSERRPEAAAIVRAKEIQCLLAERF